MAFGVRRYPEGVVFDCPGCLNHRSKDIRKAHTFRTEPPGLRRFADFDEVEWKCVACRRGLRPSHPDHTHIEGECRCPNPRPAGIRRSGGSVRDPEIPAAGDYRNRNLIDDDEFEKEWVLMMLQYPGVAEHPPGGEQQRFGRAVVIRGEWRRMNAILVLTLQV